MDLSTPLAIAAFLALSAIFHVIVASPGLFERYRAGLAQGHNYFRWVEYSLSSSLMIVIIAQLVGISDVVALLALFVVIAPLVGISDVVAQLALFGVNASMILFGWLQEKYHQPGDGGWLPFVFGCCAEAVPWIGVVV